jgi:hypothetical protein
MMKIVTAIATGCATLILATLYAWAEMWVWAAAILLLGILWLAQSWHAQRWLPTLALLLLTLAVLMGAFFNLSSFWLLTGLVAALVAWDLDHFSSILDDAPDIRDEANLKRRHFQRLGIAVGLGWLLGVAGLNMRFTFGFSLTLLLGLVLIASLGGAIRHIRREQEEP